MKRLKIYLDTSVISHLDQQDAPGKMADTKIFWEHVKNGEFDVYISPIVISEVMDCKEPKRSILLAHLGEVSYTELSESDEVIELAQKYLNAGILPKKSFDDCQHIAYACVYSCDVLASWNFKHMVNIKTMTSVKGVNALSGYREMPIYTPTMLVYGGEEDDT